MFSLICTWTNGWVNNRDASDLRRHRAHNEVTVMKCHLRLCSCGDAFIRYYLSHMVYLCRIESLCGRIWKHFARHWTMGKLYNQPRLSWTTQAVTTTLQETVERLVTRAATRLMWWHCNDRGCMYYDTVLKLCFPGGKLFQFDHYSDAIMSAMPSQITGVPIVYSTVCSGTYQRKHQDCASPAFVRGIRRWPVNSPCKGPVTRKMFPFDDAIMISIRYDVRSNTRVSDVWWISIPVYVVVSVLGQCYWVINKTNFEYL